MVNNDAAIEAVLQLKRSVRLPPPNSWSASRTPPLTRATLMMMAGRRYESWKQNWNPDSQVASTVLAIHTKVKRRNIKISMTQSTYQSVLSCSSISCLIFCFFISKSFSSRSLKDDLISFVNSYFSLKLKTLETIVMGIFSGFLHLQLMAKIMPPAKIERKQ